MMTPEQLASLRTALDRCATVRAALVISSAYTTRARASRARVAVDEIEALVWDVVQGGG